jgi:hypothetical protein
VIVGLLAVFIPVAFLTKSNDDEDKESAATEKTLPGGERIEGIERRVELIRRLRFKSDPKVREVTAAQTRTEGLAQLERQYPVARRRADEETLELLGLLEPGADLRSISGSLFGDQVAGFYNPRTKRLAVVRNASGGAPLVEITLAHELTHALEDQHFGLRDEDTPGVEDASSAYAALVEGSATAVMTEYAERYPGSVSLGDALTSLLDSAGGTGLPPYIEASALFPYLRGEQFVDELRRVGGWRLVNAAYERPPSSTEQIIHPEKYLKVEQPDPVVLKVPLTAPWRRVARGSVGEFDTSQLLQSRGPAVAEDAAAGWGGGTYELWRNGPLPDPACPAPCAKRDALVVAWKWDSATDAREFERALRPAVKRMRGGASAIVPGNTSTVLALAPTPAQAQALASRSLAGSGG